MEYTESERQFAVCIRNDEYLASLELHKVYEVIPDEFAGQKGLIRIIDESSEDYLFPIQCFVLVELPQAVIQSFAPMA